MKKIEYFESLRFLKQEEFRNIHFLVHGDIIFEKGCDATFIDCQLQVANTFCREHNIYFNGGNIFTKNCRIGGNALDGKICQANININDGVWRSENTVCQYIYGQLFNAPDRYPKLIGNGHTAGDASDSIIMTNHAYVEMKNGTYPISLTLDLSQESAVRTMLFELPKNMTLSKTFDQSNLPNVNYTLKLENFQVPFWFIFFQNLDKSVRQYSAEIASGSYVIPSLNSEKIEGSFSLPSHAELPLSEDFELNICNLNLKVRKGAIIPCWGIYGHEMHVCLRGSTNLCETFFDAGELNCIGGEGTYAFQAQATTYDVGCLDGRPCGAKLYIKNATVGWKRHKTHRLQDPTADVCGQITAHADAEVVLENCNILNCKLITKDRGTILLKNCSVNGFMQTIEEGGKILFFDEKGSDPV